MEKSKKEAIRLCRVELVKSLCLTELYEHLEQEGIFTSIAIEYIQGSGVRAAQVSRLLTDLSRRPSGDFEKFCTCLNETGQSFLADKLREKEREARALQAGGDRYANPPRAPGGSGYLGSQNPPIVTQETAAAFPGDDQQYGMRRLASGITHEEERTMEVDPPIIAQPESPHVTQPASAHNQVIAQPESEGACVSRQEWRRSADVTEEKYCLSSSPKGYALIINNENFDPNHPGQYRKRIGSKKDAEDIEHVFRNLGYATEVKEDLSAEMIHEMLKSFSQLGSHRDVDSTVVVLSSHGIHGEIVGSDCLTVPLRDLFAYFNGRNSPDLLNKPKLFFIQACRGTEEDSGCVVKDGKTESDVQPIPATSCSDEFCRSLPQEADFVVAYSTTPGNVSYRNTKKGSWFLQSLCEVLLEDAKQNDLLSMLTKVNARVAERSTERENNKQIPHPYFTLRKKFYFF